MNSDDAQVQLNKEAEEIELLHHQIDKLRAQLAAAERALEDALKYGADYVSRAVAAESRADEAERQQTEQFLRATKLESHLYNTVVERDKAERELAEARTLMGEAAKAISEMQWGTHKYPAQLRTRLITRLEAASKEEGK